MIINRRHIKILTILINLKKRKIFHQEFIKLAKPKIKEEVSSLTDGRRERVINLH